ncbi:MAG TPA: hypothetical protein PKW90_00375 [Myxococcota bacterium]|nr:hypothetical protein [Myxococcota bacterium]
MDAKDVAIILWLIFVGLLLFNGMGPLQQKQQRLWVMRRVAGPLGLEVHPPRTWAAWGPSVTGTMDGLALEIEPQEENGTPFVLMIARNLPTVLRVRRATVVTYTNGTEYLSGDPTFDREVEMVADTRVLPALLDARMRKLLRNLVRGDQGKVEMGELIWKVERNFLEEAEVRETLYDFIEMARRLKNIKADVVARLQFNAAEDPVAAVRKNALQTIIKWQPVVAQAAVRRALTDPDWGVRLLAGQNAGREGVPVLEAILLDEQVDIAARVDLIWSWAGGAGQMQLIPHLPTLLSSPTEAIRHAAIRACGMVGKEDGLKLLLSYPVNVDSEVRPLAEAIALLGPEAEPALLRALETADGMRRTAISLGLRDGMSSRNGDISPLTTGLFDAGAPLANTARALAELRANLDNGSPAPPEEFQAWDSRKVARPATERRSDARNIRSVRR